MQYILTQPVREALKRGSYLVAFNQAEQMMEGLDLEEALELTFSYLDRGPVLYDALAARWVSQAYLTGILTLHHVHWAAERFSEAWQRNRREGAENALRKLL